MATSLPNGIDACLAPIAGGLWDISFDFAGDIATADAFDTAILVSLFTDRRADPSEVPEPERRRGWIGNEATPGVEMGSKLWLFEQSRRTRETLTKLEDEVRAALRWLVDGGYAVRISRVTASLTRSGGATLEAVIETPNGGTETRFFDFWARTGVA